jgi:hypothetical protein
MGSTLKTIGILAVLVAIPVYLNFGTLSPCGMLRQTVRKQDGLASVLPDSIIDVFLASQYGELTPGRCIRLLLNYETAPVANRATPTSPPAPVSPPPQQSVIQQPPQDPMELASKQMFAAISECRTRRIDGEVNTPPNSLLQSLMRKSSATA